MERITSTGNKFIKEVRELEKKSRARRDSGLFIAEGERLCSEIPAEEIVRVFVTSDYKGRLPKGMVTDKDGHAAGTRSGKVPVFEVSSQVMEYMSDTKTSQGILAVVRQKHYSALSGDFFIILDTLQDPGNMGTVFRTAEAAGVDGIVMNRNCVDIYSPKVVRATMGAMFRMPFLICDDLSAEILRMKRHGVSVFAAHLKGNKNHWEFDYTGPTAFMIGNEGNGLSDEIASLADSYLRIPMKGETESLNAAVAATVLMYEAVRQRA
ncbi:TrmH family RNA methyltransferase [Oribacterium sp. WCC10]|uniref:TrmH family RNA methyltransferase n=1 Tax=Oribacterium sp. WCC10 TaxID=1855343 RepID=UPI001FA8CAA6|nr:RNA methyltransferase [Oribacterium sp. WCC10]